MVSSPNDWKHLLKTEISQKSFSKIFCYVNKATRKVKDFQNSPIKKFTSLFNLIVLITTNLSNAFHGHTSLRQTIFSVLMSREKFLLTDLRNALIDSYILSILYKFIHFFLLNCAIHRMGNTPDILRLRCKGKKESQAYFIFSSSFPKLLQTSLVN